MSNFEFVSVLLSIVTSLTIAHLLTAIARMVQAKDLRFSFVLAGWIGMLLFGCVDYWFSLWEARGTESWTLGYVLLWLGAATLIFLAARLVVPEGPLDGVHLPAFFLANRRRFIVPYIGAMLCGTAINSTLEAFRDLVSPQVLVWLAPLLAAYIWSQWWVQVAALVATWVLAGLYVLDNLTAL